MAEGNIDVVAFPLLSQGHIIPFMRLCELLSSRNLNVVFVTTPLNAERLSSEQADGSRVRLLEIPMPAVPGLPEGVENTERVPERLEELFFRAMEETQPSLREILVRLRPSSIIVDFWPFFLPDLATELNIYTIFFPVIGAYSQCLMYSLFISLPFLHHDGHLPPLVNLPGLPKAISMRDCDLLPPFREAIKGDPDSVKGIYTNGVRHFDQCSIVVVNTFYEMEAEMVDHLGSTFGKPVWSIGPLVPKNTTSSSSGSAENPNSSFSDSECLKWLNSREPESVIYINFGSQIALSAYQMQEVAAGLEASGQYFLWAVKKPNDPEDMDEASFISSLPVDLQAFIHRHNSAGDQSVCRGLVVFGWVPQSQILGHPATGGHVSHCGWNSTLESIGQGVPILAWPFQHDHPFEAKLLVEELGVAEEIQQEKNENGVFVVKREEVERAAKLIIRGEKGKEMRKKALQLKEGAKRATEQGGSSFKNLDRLGLLIRSKSN